MKKDNNASEKAKEDFIRELMRLYLKYKKDMISKSAGDLDGEEGSYLFEKK